MFRSVRLANSIPGRLFLHSMPGRHEPWDAFVAEAQRVNLDTIVCLTSEREIQKKSPPYAAARSTKGLPCGVKNFVIPDLSTPTEAQRKAFRTFVVDLAEELRIGKACLVHCAGGIGRTGTVATCLLVELGVELDVAKREVEVAGSYPEVVEQESFIQWYATLSENQYV